MELPQGSHYIFYEQFRDFEILLKGKGFCTLLVIPISELHHLVSQSEDDINFEAAKALEADRYHKFETSGLGIKDCLVELEREQNPLRMEAKKFELLGHLFSKTDIQTYKCPFLNLKENVEKVRNAKNILLYDLTNAPTIKQLSREVGLNEFNLKTGFKEIYGKPVYTYLKEHRIQYAQKLLNERELRVNEIAELVGYSNVSHFIDAFKKKYGLTPKQYVMNQK
jgi:AraC-like DNA-binding protein